MKHLGIGKFASKIRPLDVKMHSHVLKLLVDIESSLGTLLEATAREIRFLQRQVSVIPRTMEVGLAYLPNEILARIFELARPEEFDMGNLDLLRKLPITLSHVCRRFRYVALALPGLWTELKTDQSPKAVSTFLSRSKESMLSVEVSRWRISTLKQDLQTRHVLAFLDAVIPHSRLMGSFTFIVDEELEDIMCGSPRLRRSLTDLQLPNLSRLKLVHSSYATDDANDLYSSWVMPNLQYLCLTNLIPRPNFASSLLRCEILLRNFLDMESYDIDLLLRFLRPLSKLEELTLDIERVILESTGSQPTVVLTALKKFSLSSDCPDGFMPRLLIESLCLPNLSTLGLSFYQAKGEVLQPNLPNLIRDLLRPEAFTRVSQLELEFEGFEEYTLVDAKDGICSLFDIVFDRLPNLEQLIIRAPEDDLTSFFEVTRKKAGRPLRLLKLDFCGRANGRDVVDFLRELEGKGGWNDSSVLEVVKCGSFRNGWKDVLAFLPKERFVWKG